MIQIIGRAYSIDSFINLVSVLKAVLHLAWKKGSTVSGLFDNWADIGVQAQPLTV